MIIIIIIVALILLWVLCYVLLYNLVVQKGSHNYIYVDQYCSETIIILAYSYNSETFKMKVNKLYLFTYLTMMITMMMVMLMMIMMMAMMKDMMI